MKKRVAAFVSAIALLATGAASMGCIWLLVDELNNINILSENPTLVYTGENNGGSVKTTNISWNEDKGILLKLNNPLENNTKYSAEIT